MRLTRDSVVWTALFVSGVLTYAMSHFQLITAAFPGLSIVWESRIELLSGLLAAIAGLLRMSPLALSQEGKDRFLDGTDSKDILSGGDTTKKIITVILGASVLFPIVSCASLGPALVRTETAIHDSIKVSRSGINTFCDLKLDIQACQRLNDNLGKTIADADAFNRAVARNSTAEVPTMILSLSRLAEDVDEWIPDQAQRDEIKRKLNDALALLRALFGR